MPGIERLDKLGVAIYAINQLHRHRNDIVLFDSTGAHVVAAVTPQDLANGFPFFARGLVDDGRFAINAMRRGARWRNAKLVTELTCNFLDIDLHDGPEEAFAEARMSIARGVRENAFPHPSVRALRSWPVADLAATQG